SSLSFRFVALRALGLLSRRPQNDLDNESNIIFASSFVWRNTKTRFALCDSFRPPFSKGGPVGARSPANEQFDKSKFEAQTVTIWGLRSKFAPLVQNQIVNRGRVANSQNQNLKKM
ncbi:MAG: hypothetical protein J6B12_06070, partial [Clostridia bacterium]|nr:hypothetical protein [Clostridia bacterium]